MKLLPLGAEESSDWEDGFWMEKPGYPVVDCSWIHRPPDGCSVPEFEFEEGDDKNKNEPGPVFYVGSGNDCHVRLSDGRVPERVCRVSKEGRIWLLEALLPGAVLHLGQQPLSAGERVQLQDGDVFSLEKPPTALAYKVRINDEDNWYIDEMSEKDYPNKYPGRFPFRSSLFDAPEAPEELKRLAWSTDQMRRRSEEDQVRVADWAAFSQHVKRHYYKYGIECTPWAVTGRNRPVDPKPPNLRPRAYPTWICDLLEKERQQPGMGPERELPFASCLRASGRTVPQPLDFRSASLATTAEMDRGRLEQAQEPHVESPARSSPDVALPVTAAVTAKRADASPENLHLRLSFREWLEGMDDCKFLLQYHDRIAANFDSLEQVHEIYVRGGEISQAFFKDAGITKLGHKRIIEKWFRDFCG